MRYEKISDPDTVNKLYRMTRLQKELMELQNDDSCKVVKVLITPEDYVNVRSAQSSYRTCINRMGLRMKARVFDGELYLIKLED